MSLCIRGLFDGECYTKNVSFGDFDPVGVYTISCTPSGIVVVYEDGHNAVYGSDSLLEKVNMISPSRRIEMLISYYSYSLVLLDNGKLGFFDKGREVWIYTPNNIYRHIVGIPSYACAIDLNGNVHIIRNNQITRTICLEQPAVSVVPTDLYSIFILTRDGFVYNVVGDKEPVKNKELKQSVITKLAGNSNHVMAIEKEDIFYSSTTLYCLGHNTHGQLATPEGRRYSTNKFVKAFYLDKLGDLKNVSCGLDFTVVQNELGAIIGVGQNENYQIGTWPFPHIFSEPNLIDQDVTWFCASHTYTAWGEGFRVAHDNTQFGEVDPSLHIKKKTKGEIPMTLPAPTRNTQLSIPHIPASSPPSETDNNLKNQIDELKKEQERLRQIIKQQEMELKIWKPFSEDETPKSGKNNPHLQASQFQKMYEEERKEHARQIGIQQEIFTAQESVKISTLEYQNKKLKEENEKLKAKITQDQIDKTNKLMKVPSIETETKKLLSDHQNMLNELKQIRMQQRDTVAEFNKQLKLKILQIEKLVFPNGRNQLNSYLENLSDYDLLMAEKDKITINIIDDRNKIREALIDEQEECKKLREEIEAYKAQEEKIKEKDKIIEGLTSRNEELLEMMEDYRREHEKFIEKFCYKGMDKLLMTAHQNRNKKVEKNNNQKDGNTNGKGKRGKKIVLYNT